jgi:hypothetical protein
VYSSFLIRYPGENSTVVFALADRSTNSSFSSVFLPFNALFSGKVPCKSFHKSILIPAEFKSETRHHCFLGFAGLKGTATLGPECATPDEVSVDEKQQNRPAFLALDTY